MGRKKSVSLAQFVCLPNIRFTFDSSIITIRSKATSLIHVLNMPIIRFLTDFLKKRAEQDHLRSRLDDLFRLCFPVPRYFAGKNLKRSLTAYLYADQSYVHSVSLEGKPRLHRASTLRARLSGNGCHV